MKTTTIIFLLLATTIVGQKTYEVFPSTKGNEVVLSIVNESQTTNLEKVTVALTNNPKGIETNNKLIEIDKLKIGEEKEVLFTFEAKRIPGTQKDTLKFTITDSKGGSWKKEIILAYTLPKEFKLEQNYPNPFNPTTVIEFTVPQSGRYNLSVYNLLGQLVNVLADDEYQPGYYKVTFDANKLASGIYIYRLSGKNVNISKKMLLIK